MLNIALISVSYIAALGASQSVASAKLSSRSEQIIISATFDSDITADAIRRGNAVQAEQYRTIILTRRKLANEQRKGTETKAELASFKAENVQLNAKMAQLISQLAEKDEKYARDVRRLQDDLGDLLDSKDPKVVETLERYSSGDPAALDTLQDVIRLIRSQRVKQSAADQRVHARYVGNDRLRGMRSTSEELNSWNEAISLDSQNFEQWIKVGAIQAESGNAKSALIAADYAIPLAFDDYERSAARQIKVKALSTLKRYNDAFLINEEIIKKTREISKKLPSDNHILNRDLSSSLLDRGDILLHLNDRKNAIASFEEAVSIREKLATFWPAPERRRDLAVAVARLAAAQTAINDTSAKSEYERAITIFSGLSDNYIDRADYKLDTIISYLMYAKFLFYKSNFLESEKVAIIAYNGYEKISSKDKTSLFIQKGMIECAMLLVDIYHHNNDVISEVRYLETAVNMMLIFSASHESYKFESVTVLLGIHRIISIYNQLGNYEKSTEWLKRAEVVCQAVGKTIDTSDSRCEVER